MTLASDLLAYTVIPVLMELEPTGVPFSDTAAHLVMGTAAQETQFGHLVQIGGGPGLGMWQITPSLIPSILSRCTPALRAAVAKFGDPANALQVSSNLALGAALCRCWYWVVPNALPLDTVSGLWSYYKAWFNTSAGAATEAEWNANFPLTGIAIPA